MPYGYHEIAMCMLALMLSPSKTLDKTMTTTTASARARAVCDVHPACACAGLANNVNRKGPRVRTPAPTHTFSLPPRRYTNPLPSRTKSRMRMEWNHSGTTDQSIDRQQQHIHKFSDIMHGTSRRNSGRAEMELSHACMRAFELRDSQYTHLGLYTGAQPRSNPR